jgi:hypothetical protein
MDRVDGGVVGGENAEHDAFGNERYVVVSRERTLRSAEVAFQRRQRKFEHDKLTIGLA